MRAIERVGNYRALSSSVQYFTSLSIETLVLLLCSFSTISSVNISKPCLARAIQMWRLSRRRSNFCPHCGIIFSEDLSQWTGQVWFSTQFRLTRSVQDVTITALTPSMKGHKCCSHLITLQHGLHYPEFGPAEAPELSDSGLLLQAAFPVSCGSPEAGEPHSFRLLGWRLITAGEWSIELRTSASLLQAKTEEMRRGRTIIQPLSAFALSLMATDELDTMTREHRIDK